MAQLTNPMGMFNGMTPEEIDIARKQKLVDMLTKQAEQPLEGQMVSGRYVAPSWTQMLAKGLNAYMAGKTEKQAADMQKQFGEKQRTDFMDTAQKYAAALKGTPESNSVSGIAMPNQEAAKSYSQAVDTTGNFNLGAPSPLMPNLSSMAPQNGAPNLAQGGPYADMAHTPNATQINSDALTSVPSFAPVNHTAAVPGSHDAALNIAMQSQSPIWQQYAMKEAMTPDKPVVVGRSLVDPNTGKVVATDSTWAAEQQAARQAKQDELQAKMEDARLSRQERLDAQKELAKMNIDARRDIAAQSSADRRMIAGMVNSQRQQKNVPKLPTSALKLQQEDLDAVGTASSIQSDLGALKNQIDSGQLKLGPVNNLISAGRNMAGISDDNSRNYASFRSTLEKLRNDSLRLNKGVQTEGDAQRAWNELISNINDPQVVSKRMGEIQKINERAANLHRMNIDNIRSNFGVDPLDATGYTDQPAAVGTPAPAGKVKRYNPKTGRIE